MDTTTSEKKELQKTYNKICFINAACEIIDEEGVENISIRKISKKSGFHNSTIYLYFKDLEELIMLSSIKYMRHFSCQLEHLDTPDNASHKFLQIWDFFFECIEDKPNLFNHFFYGSRSDCLSNILETYYKIFPDEKPEYKNEIDPLFFGENITERNLAILSPVLDETGHADKKDYPLINDLIVSYFKYKLELRCKTPTLDNQAQKKEFLDTVRYLTGIPRN